MSLPTPSFESTKTDELDVFTTPPESGRFLSANRHWLNQASLRAKSVRRFHLVYKPGQLTVAQAQSIVAQFDASLGGSVPFSFTPWDEVSAVQVRFADDELTFSPTSIVAAGVEFDLLEELF